MLGYTSKHMIHRAYVGPHLHLMAKRIKSEREKRCLEGIIPPSGVDIMLNRSWAFLNLNLKCDEKISVYNFISQLDNIVMMLREGTYIMKLPKLMWDISANSEHIFAFKFIYHWVR